MASTQEAIIMNMTVTSLSRTNSLSATKTCLASTCIFPPIKKRKVSLNTTGSCTSSNSISTGIYQCSSFDGSPKNTEDSAQVCNMRIVSDASIRKDSRPRNHSSGYRINDFDMLQYNHLNQSNSAGIRVDTSSSSTVSSSSIQEAISRLVSSTGMDAHTQQTVADECYRFAIWTSCQGRSSCRFPRSSSPTCLTIHEVAMMIVSFNGMTALLNALEEYPQNVQIQEHACMALGNILNVLYRRRIANTTPSYQELSMIVTGKKGNAIHNRILLAMQNHSHNVSVHCAAIVALHQFFHSTFFNPLYSNITKEEQLRMLNDTHEMFLPSHVRQMAIQIRTIVQQLK
jgi:hypothetical protein